MTVSLTVVTLAEGRSLPTDHSPVALAYSHRRSTADHNQSVIAERRRSPYLDGAADPYETIVPTLVNLPASLTKELHLLTEPLNLESTACRPTIPLLVYN